MSRKLVKSTFTLAPGLPMQISIDSGNPVDPLTDHQKLILRRVGRTVKAYMKAAEELLQGKFTSIRDSAPLHLREQGNVLVACCEEGIVIRYDQKTEDKKLFAGWLPGDLSKIVPLISQSFIYCYASKSFTSTIPTTGSVIRLTSISPTGETKDILSARIGYDAVVDRPNQLPTHPSKPYCLLSVQSLFEINLVGEVFQDGISPGSGQKFMTRTPLRLPVGWECIEVYPFFNIEDWKPEYAPLWAENDILASTVMRQFRETELQTLDPNASARKQLSKIIKAYQRLLDSNPDREELLQSFLKENPVLLCPAHKKFWPKLPLGAK